MGARVLVHDPEPNARLRMTETLRASGIEAVATGTPEEVVLAARCGCELAIVDADVRDQHGRSMTQLLRSLSPSVEVVACIGEGHVSDAVAALRQGAFTVLERPVRADTVLETVLHGLTRVVDNRQSFLLEPSPVGGVDRLIGESPAIEKLRAALIEVADDDGAPVLLVGEAGTGKLMAAELLHALGMRREQRRMRMSFIGLSEDEAEARLFGRGRAGVVRAAGADGLLALAHRGVAILQHVEYMPVGVQRKLREFLDTGRYTPLGGTTSAAADVRVVATTRADLGHEVEMGHFQQDLYYRLRVLPLGVPALRTRGTDLRLLISYFLSHFNQARGCAVTGVTGPAVRVLQDYVWPSNVRELRNAVEEAVLTRGSGRLEPTDFPMIVKPNVESPFRLPTFGLDLEDLERGLVIQALQRTSGNRTRAAKLLGLNRDQMRYRVDKFELQEQRFGAKASEPIRVPGSRR